MPTIFDYGLYWEIPFGIQMTTHANIPHKVLGIDKRRLDAFYNPALLGIFIL